MSSPNKSLKCIFDEFISDRTLTTRMHCIHAAGGNLFDGATSTMLPVMHGIRRFKMTCLGSFYATTSSSQSHIMQNKHIIVRRKNSVSISRFGEFMTSLTTTMRSLRHAPAGEPGAAASFDWQGLQPAVADAELLKFDASLMASTRRCFYIAPDPPFHRSTD